MKRHLGPLAVIALIAVGYVWAVLPTVNAFEYVPANKAWNAGAFKDSLQAPQLRVGDTFYPPSSATLPTCDSDLEPAIQFDESDNLWKGCSDQTGTFQWLPLGRDRDQDGFRDDIDGSPDVAATGYDDPVAYQVTTTYSGTDAQITVGSNTAYLSGGSLRQRQCQAFVLCREKGDLDLVSFTIGSGAPRFNPSNVTDTCSTASVSGAGNLTDYLVGGDTFSGTYLTASASIAILGATCTGTRDT